MVHHTRSDRIFLIINTFLLTLFFLTVLYPIWIVVASSFSDPKYVATGEVVLLPKGFSLNGYKAILEYRLIVQGFGNSLVLMVVGTVLCLVVTLLGGYPLSRSDLPGKRPIMFLFTFTMYFSGGMIPTFLLIRDLHLMNTLWALIIPSAINVWNIILAKTYFQTSIPSEILQAARVDGCDDFTYLVRIGVPLAKPIIAVLGLFAAVGMWNSYFNAMLFLNDVDLFPLQLVLRDILVVNATNITQMSRDVESIKRQQEMVALLKYAVIVVSSAPLMILYPFVQKFFVKGILVGSLKG